MTGPTVRSGATLDLTVRADRPVVGVPVLPGPAGPTGPVGPQGPAGNPTQYDLRGTGYPEGAVTAPVGTSYTDTAATNGAIRWIKATGTAATGWRVAWGDTGWRDITSLLVNGWTATTLVIRRRNMDITGWLNITNAQLIAATSDTLINTADLGTPGWAPNRPIAGTVRDSLALFGLSTTDLNNGRMALFTNAITSWQITRASIPAGANPAGYIRWPTSDTWPTTLPGTAVAG